MKRAVVMLLLATLLGAGACTEPNPGYTSGVDGGNVDRDLGQLDFAADGPAVPDLQVLPDQADPDLLPDPCAAVGDCNDGLGCTDDKCIDGRCANPVREGFCVIGGKCYAKDGGEAAFPCLVCDPEQNQRDWTKLEDGKECPSDALDCTNDVCRDGRCMHERVESSCLIDDACYDDGKGPEGGCVVCDAATNAWVEAQDNTPCADDGLDCTEDVCRGGDCSHVVVSGCLVNNVCRPADYVSPTDDCRLCLPQLDTEALVFADGKLCDGGKGICAFDACRHAVDKAGEWLPRVSGSDHASSARCLSVDDIADGGGVWVVGSYNAGASQSGGFLTRVDLNNGQQILTPRALGDISHRAATGGGGVVYTHDTQGWSRANTIEQFIGSTARNAVGGYRTGDRDVLYFAGVQASPASTGIVRCVLDRGAVSCQDQQGLTTGTTFGPLTVGQGSSTRIWTVGNLLAGPTIYSALESNSTFGDAPLEGCDGSTLCGYHLDGELRGLHASSDEDVWAVGDGAVVLHYDGVRWSEARNLPAAIADYTLTAVYSSTTTPLVLILGYESTLVGRRVALFGYNRAVQRGAGPLELDLLSQITVGDPGMITHVGGGEPDQLWLVGYRSSSIINAGTAGWMLRLE